jgi:hypothetical protein
MRHVRKTQRRTRTQVGRQVLGDLIELVVRPRRGEKELVLARRVGRITRGRFFEYHMRIGASDA